MITRKYAQIQHFITVKKFAKNVKVVSIFKLSRQKWHFLFPVPPGNYYWVFLFHEKLIPILENNDIEIDILSEQRKPLGNFKLSTTRKQIEDADISPSIDNHQELMVIN